MTEVNALARINRRCLDTVEADSREWEPPEIGINGKSLCSTRKLLAPQGTGELLSKDVTSSNTEVSWGVVLIANLSAMTNTYHKEKRGLFCLIGGVEAKVEGHIVVTV